MIVIVDYQMGNLRSVEKAFERVGHPATVSSKADDIARADKMILPGVGAMEDAMAELTERNSGPTLARCNSSKQTVSGHLPGSAVTV